MTIPEVSLMAARPFWISLRERNLAAEESTFFYGLSYNSPYNPPHNKRTF
jgi:hypothetical protein